MNASLRIRGSSCATLVALAAAVASLVLGLSNAAGPSLWHDELVHVYVARTLIETGTAALPSGQAYPSGFLYHYTLAGWMLLFGDGETAVRSLSAVFMATAVIVLYGLTRRLLGTPTALVAAWGFALSPWTVAWARQSRFYALMLLVFLLFLGAVWLGMQAKTPRRCAAWLTTAAVLFAAGLATALHSVLFLAPIAAYAIILGIVHRQSRRAALAAGGVLALFGLAVVGIYALTLPPVDYDAVFGGGRLNVLENLAHFHRGGHAQYYLIWLNNNLGLGFLLLMGLGGIWMVVREGRPGLFTALAFWVPMAVLSVVIDYRLPRFLLFAYPIGVVCWAYALVRLTALVPRCREGLAPTLVAFAILFFLFRLGLSAADLLGNTLEVARGADITLARRHPQWREPARWVREHVGDGVVISTTWLPVHYYVGRCDEWFPSRLFPGEVQESGLEGLRTVDDLAAFVATNPRGMLLAEHFRWKRWERQRYGEDIAWVEEHMHHHPEASSADVKVYSWGYPELAPPRPEPK